MSKMLGEVENTTRVMCQTSQELVALLFKNPKKTVRLLRPRNGVFNLSLIFSVYAICNREEEGKFVKKVHHI